jgi:hypothetical protein
MKDRILIYQDYTLHNFGLARMLQEKHDCDLFAIFDVTDNMNKFFQKQKIVNYNQSWFLYDYIKKSQKPDLEYLSQFEKKYGIELWKLANNDRIFFKYNVYYNFSENEILSILEQQCKFFENIIETIKPDFVIFPLTNSGRMEIFYEMCLKLGIKILMLNATRFGGMVFINEEAEKIDYFEKEIHEKEIHEKEIHEKEIHEKEIHEKEIHENVKSRSLNNLRDILYKVHSFDSSIQFSSQFLKSKKMALKAGIQFFLFSKNSNLKTHYTYYGRHKIKIFFITIFWSLKKRYRLYLINKNLSRTIDDEKFIFFPLITEPERGLLIAAPFHTNLIELVTHVVKSLPMGYKLYVKDHQAMDNRDWRSFSFYKEIMNLPNVKMLHHTVHPKNLLPKCSMVITVGGTAGFEAAFYEKPTITFVDALYSSLKSVEILNDLKELPQLIQKQLNIKFDLNDLNNFVSVLEKNSFAFDWSGFDSLAHHILFYDGFLSDVEINEKQMNKLLDAYSTQLETLANEHIKKIIQHKKYQS